MNNLTVVQCDGNNCQKEPSKCANITAGLTLSRDDAKGLHMRGVSCCVWSDLKSPLEQVFVLQRLLDTLSFPFGRRQIGLFLGMNCVGCCHAQVDRYCAVNRHRNKEPGGTCAHRLRLNWTCLPGSHAWACRYRIYCLKTISEGDLVWRVHHPQTSNHECRNGCTWVF